MLNFKFIAVLAYKAISLYTKEAVYIVQHVEGSTDCFWLVYTSDFRCNFYCGFLLIDVDKWICMLRIYCCIGYVTKGVRR